MENGAGRHNPTGVPSLGWQDGRDLGAEPGDRVGKVFQERRQHTQPKLARLPEQELEISCLQLLPGSFFPFNNPTLGTSSLIIKFTVD